MQRSDAIETASRARSNALRAAGARARLGEGLGSRLERSFCVGLRNETRVRAHVAAPFAGTPDVVLPEQALVGKPAVALVVEHGGDRHAVSVTFRLASSTGVCTTRGRRKRRSPNGSVFDEPTPVALSKTKSRIFRGWQSRKWSKLPEPPAHRIVRSLATSPTPAAQRLRGPWTGLRSRRTGAFQLRARTP